MSYRVRLLGVTIAADLGPDKHLANVCKTCFFGLRQVRSVRRTLGVVSVKTQYSVCHIIIAAESWCLPQRRSQTSCNRFRTLQRVWSQEPRNTSMVFHGCCVTGWLYHSGCSTSLPCLFIGVFGTELQGTSPTAACQSPKFPAANISVRPAVANWISGAFVATHLAPAGFLSRRSDGLELTAWFVAWSGRRVWTL